MKKKKIFVVPRNNNTNKSYKFGFVISVKMVSSDLASSRMDQKAKMLLVDFDQIMQKGSE